MLSNFDFELWFMRKQDQNLPKSMLNQTYLELFELKCADLSFSYDSAGIF
jgi:hypothetical protein